MQYANMPCDYKAKLKRKEEAINHIESDHVPVIMMQTTWGISYANTKISDVFYDRKRMAQLGSAPLKDLYTDFMLGGSLPAPMAAYDFLQPETPQYFISDDGHTMQHKEISPMKADEYSQLIANPKRYLENVILPRRYPILNRPYPENYKVFKGAYEAVVDFMQGMMYLAEYQKTEFGIPAFFDGSSYMPMDYMMDFLRGFRGTMSDMRRHPEELKEALNALTDYLLPLYLGPNVPKGGVLMAPLHAPPFLSPKQFDEFYWPSFKRVIDAANKKGVRVLLGLEGDWTPHIEKLKEFPKNSLIGTIENVDMFWAKKAVGDYITLIGGMPCNLLKHGTKEECINLTKKLIDECGPNGGYIFSTDKLLMSPGDINIDNYKACLDTILTYK